MFVSLVICAMLSSMLLKMEQLGSCTVVYLVYFNQMNAVASAAVETKKPNRSYSIESRNIYSENHRWYGWLARNWSFVKWLLKLQLNWCKVKCPAHKSLHLCNWNVAISVFIFIEHFNYIQIDYQLELIGKRKPSNRHCLWQQFRNSSYMFVKQLPVPVKML